MRRVLTALCRYKFADENVPSNLAREFSEAIQKARKVSDPQLRQQEYLRLEQQIVNRIKAQNKQENLQKVKDYLAEGLQNEEANEKPGLARQQGKEHIPVNLALRKLQYEDKKILLIGVEEENEDHCIYVKKMIEKLGARTVFTALPPDMPYFIKTEDSFVEEWGRFMKDWHHAKQAKFYLNTSPKHVSEFCLTSPQRQLVRSGLNKSKQFNQLFYAITQYSKQHGRYLPNGLLTPLLVSGVDKLYFCDYPILKERELWALTIPTQELRNLFDLYHSQYHKNKQMLFDPRILFPRKTLSRKFRYMANAIKYGMQEAQQPGVFVCPAEYVQLFSLEWKQKSAVSGLTDLSTRLELQKPATFIEFVEKLVIMDIILENVVDKYFIKNFSFPYKALNTAGGRENIGKIFVVWDHFYDLYTKALAEAPKF